MILNNNLTWNYKCFFPKFAAFSNPYKEKAILHTFKLLLFFKLNAEVNVGILFALKNILKKFIKQKYLQTEIDIYS